MLALRSHQRVKSLLVLHTGDFQGDFGKNSTGLQFFFKLWWLSHLTHTSYPNSVDKPHLNFELIAQTQLVWLAVPLCTLQMAVISKGEKGSWILLNTTFFASLLDPNITIYEKFLLKEFGTLTLVWPQCQRTLDNLWLQKYCPRTHPPCSQGCGCFESIHPQRGWNWLQLHSIYAYKGHFWGLLHTSRPAQYFSFTCFHGSWEDQRGLCVGGSLLSHEAQQFCFGLRSECLFTLRVWATW